MAETLWSETNTYGANLQKEAWEDTQHNLPVLVPEVGSRGDKTGWCWSKKTLALFVCLNFSQRECSNALSM